MPLKAWIPACVLPRSLPLTVSTIGSLGISLLPNLDSEALHAVLAAMHGGGQHAQDLENHRRADERRVARRIEGRRHLDDIAANEVEPVEQADHALRLGSGEAADFGCAGPRCVDRVEPVDIKADIGRAVADDLPRLFHDPLRAEPEEFLDMNDSDADALGPFLLVRRIHRAAHADLDHTLRVGESLLDGAAERRSAGA